VVLSKTWEVLQLKNRAKSNKINMAAPPTVGFLVVVSLLWGARPVLSQSLNASLISTVSTSSRILDTAATAGTCTNCGPNGTIAVNPGVWTFSGACPTLGDVLLSGGCKTSLAARGAGWDLDTASPLGAAFQCAWRCRSANGTCAGARGYPRTTRSLSTSAVRPPGRV
jgi:hypothetical protein